MKFYKKLFWFLLGALFVIVLTKLYIKYYNVRMLRYKPSTELTLFYSREVLKNNTDSLTVGYCSFGETTCINCKK